MYAGISYWCAPSPPLFRAALTVNAASLEAGASSFDLLPPLGVPCGGERCVTIPSDGSFASQVGKYPFSSFVAHYITMLHCSCLHMKGANLVSRVSPLPGPWSEKGREEERPNEQGLNSVVTWWRIPLWLYITPLILYLAFISSGGSLIKTSSCVPRTSVQGVSATHHPHQKTSAR